MTGAPIARPLTVRALERALRRRILSWPPEEPRDLLARLREEVEQTLAGDTSSMKVAALDLDHLV